MTSYTTTKNSLAGHREVTIQLARAPIVPDVQQVLLGFFEAAVARGTRFAAGQTLQIGWSLLRLCDRPDGTLGVQERELSPDVTWTESVDRALADLWMQKAIGVSLGLHDDLVFPRQDDAALVADCAMDADELVMTRLPVTELPEGFSGWMLACTQDHDHGERHMVPLLAIAATKPGLVQLLALPHEVAVLVLYKKVDAGHARIEPHVFRGTDELVPAEGSYLAALQQR